MIVEMPPLDRVRGAVGIEKPHAFPAFKANARINEAIGSNDPKLSAEGLARRIVVRIERGLDGSDRGFAGHATAHRQRAQSPEIVRSIRRAHSCAP